MKENVENQCMDPQKSGVTSYSPLFFLSNSPDYPGGCTVHVNNDPPPSKTSRNATFQTWNTQNQDHHDNHDHHSVMVIQIVCGII